MITRPMLAATAKAINLPDVGWPALCSPKVDGIRCIVHPELGPVTRSFKPVPNEYIRDHLRSLAGSCHLDGELVVVDGNGRALLFNDIQSEVMSFGGQPDYRFLVFDCFKRPDSGFLDRDLEATTVVKLLDNKHVKMIQQKRLHSEEEFLAFMEECLTLRYEGAMIRHEHGPYKSGRSTLKQGWLLKYKEWLDAEGTVIGFEELMHNANEDVKDEFGLAKRSHAKDGLIPAGTLGNLLIDTEWGELSLGSGFDHAQRQEIWQRNQGISGEASDLGRTVTFKYIPHGMKDKPRHPIFLHFREDE